jgi:hypothetical protein
MHVRFLQKVEKYGQRPSYQLLMEELYFGVNKKSEHRTWLRRRKWLEMNSLCLSPFVKADNTKQINIPFEWVNYASYLGFPFSNQVQDIFNPDTFLVIFLSHSTNYLTASYTKV